MRMQPESASYRPVATFRTSKRARSRERACSRYATERATSLLSSCSTFERKRERESRRLVKVVVSDSHMADWVDDHALLVATMREVGSLALRYFRTDVNAWEKEGGTPVSDADIAVDTHLKQRLGAARPESGRLHRRKTGGGRTSPAPRRQNAGS